MFQGGEGGSALGRWHTAHGDGRGREGKGKEGCGLQFPFSKVPRHSSQAVHCTHKTCDQAGNWSMLCILRAFPSVSRQTAAVYLTVTPTGHSLEGGRFVFFGQRTQLSLPRAAVVLFVDTAPSTSAGSSDLSRRRRRRSRAGFVALRAEMARGRSPLACPPIWRRASCMWLWFVGSHVGMCFRSGSTRRAISQKPAYAWSGDDAFKIVCRIFLGGREWWRWGEKDHPAYE